VKLHRLLPIVVLTLASTPSFAADKPDGAVLYRQRCASCHGAPDRPTTLAPNLTGVVGRKAASTAFNYSAALKASGLTWSRANLDRFLTAPARLVPGTRMVIGVSDPAQRAALLDYLASRR